MALTEKHWPKVRGFTRRDMEDVGTREDADLKLKQSILEGQRHLGKIQQGIREREKDIRALESLKMQTLKQISTAHWLKDGGTGMDGGMDDEE